MALPEQQPPGNPAETNFQRLLRQASERRTLQQQQVSPVVEPVVPVQPSESLGKPAEIPVPQETNFQRLLRQTKEKKDREVPAEQPATAVLPEPEKKSEPTPEEKVKTVEGIFEVAQKAAVDAYDNYEKSLGEDESYKPAQRSVLDAYGVYDRALRERKLAGEVFGNAPEDKEIYEKYRNLAKVRDEIATAFRATREGKRLWEEYKSYANTRDKAREDLKRAKAGLIVSSAPAGQEARQPEPAITNRQGDKEDADMLPWMRRRGRRERPVEVKIIPAKEKKKKFPRLFKKKEPFRVVDIEIGGKSTGAEWFQAISPKGKIKNGEFYFEDFSDQEDLSGNIDIPKGTRLQIIMPSVAVIHIAGGKDANLPKMTMQNVHSVGGTIIFNTGDYEDWEKNASDFSKDEGGVTIADLNASQPQGRLTRNISREDALRFLTEFHRRKMSQMGEQAEASAKTKAEIKAEAEETAWLTALAGPELQGEGKKAELEDEIKKFRDNLRELGYGYDKNSRREAPFIKFRDEEGDSISGGELATVFGLGWGYESLKKANRFLEYEVEMGETERAERKIRREAEKADFESNCRELGYTPKVLTSSEGKPIIALRDKKGKYVTKRELGGIFGYTSLADAIDFLGEEPKDPAERAKRNADEKTRLKRERNELKANCRTLGYRYKTVESDRGRLIIILDKKGNQVTVEEDGSGYGYSRYAGAISFVKEKIAEAEKK